MSHRILNRLAHLGMVTAISLAPLAIAGGCGSSRPADVPKSASLKTQGNDRVVYTADDNGRVWIADHGTNDILYSGYMRRGDRLVLDPGGNRVTINDQVVAHRDIGRRDRDIYFQPGPAGHGAELTQNDLQVDRPAQIPAAASLKGEGKDRVEFSPNRDGSVWVTDADTKNVVYMGRMARGQTLVIEPKDNRLAINGQPVYSGNLPNHDHRVFFLANEPVAADGTVIAPSDASAASSVVIAPTGAAVVARPVGVPATADLKADSTGRTEVTADSDGTVWVVDAASNRVVYDGTLLRGEHLVINPEGNRIRLNTTRGGNQVYDRDLSSGRYRVFFQPGR
jgi:hypothetical protein